MPVQRFADGEFRTDEDAKRLDESEEWLRRIEQRGDDFEAEVKRQLGTQKRVDADGAWEAMRRREQSKWLPGSAHTDTEQRVDADAEWEKMRLRELNAWKK